MDVKRLFDLPEFYKQNWPDRPDILAGKDNGIWIKHSIDDFIEHVNNISYGLLALGVEKGDKIASITFNRPEWNFIDLGIQQIGAIHVSIYPTISDSDYEYILTHAEVKYIFVAGIEMYRRISHILPRVPSLMGIYTFKNLHGFQHLGELLDLGKNNKNPEKLKTLKDAITESDTPTIIYTSGTFGNPKGVVLTHRNILSNVKFVAAVPPQGPGSRVMSLLPICHIYERMLNYLYLYKGYTIYYCDNIALVGDYIKEVQPTIVCVVPRLLEKIYDKIVNTGSKLKGIKRIIFYWALKLGHHYEMYGARGWWYETKLGIARKLVFSKWKLGLGKNLDLIVSGGAALQPRLGRIFWAAGFRVLEGYGLTETSPVISVCNLNPKSVKFGTVGPVLEGVEVKIADDGEILSRGACVMKEYYKEPALTADAVDSEGWFHTGDIGEVDSDGLLKITGRKKEIFKTSFGKYIAPQLIENKFKESLFIDNIMVVGENQKFAGAMIAPDFNHLKNWCAYKGIVYTTNDEMLGLPRIKKRFAKEVAKYNDYFGVTEKIKSYDLIKTEWSIESGELTATLKLRRTYLFSKYATEIENLFS
jgi:long-chain acyl-CoA synthetase